MQYDEIEQKVQHLLSVTSINPDWVKIADMNSNENVLKVSI